MTSPGCPKLFKILFLFWKYKICFTWQQWFSTKFFIILIVLRIQIFPDSTINHIVPGMQLILGMAFFFVKFSNTKMSSYLFQMWLSYKIISIVMKLNHWKTKLSTHTLLLNRLAYSFSFVFHCHFSLTELSWLLYLFICTELPYLLEPLGSQYSAFFN